MIVLKPAAVALLALAPSLTTGLLLVAREVSRDLPIAHEPPLMAPIPLAVPSGPPQPAARAARRFSLVAGVSRAGFESRDEQSGVRAEARPVHGQLHFDAAGAPSGLDLVLDLAELPGEEASDGTDLWWNLLGAREDSTARLVLNTMRLRHTSVASVVEIDAVGTLSLHGEVQIVRLQLQSVQLCPGRVRLQVIGEIDVEDFGLPRLYRMLVLPIDPRVTIWADLVLAVDGGGSEGK